MPSPGSSIRGPLEEGNRFRTLPDGKVDLSDAGTALKKAVDSLAASVGESGAAIISEPLLAVAIPETLLQQVFQNLPSNAIKYRGEEPARIHMAVRRHGDSDLFSVRDNGIGIEPQYFERIFGVFKRLHGRDDYPGTGLGLAISRHIVENYGRKMRVESEPGKGSTFPFTLPGESGK